MVWVEIITIIITLALSILLAPKPKIENARAQTIDDTRFPRADEGDPIPLVLGYVRLRAPNTVWYGDFRAWAVTQRIKTGLFSSKRVIVGYRYFLGMDLALCLGGAGVYLYDVWVGKTRTPVYATDPEDIVGVYVSLGNDRGMFGGTFRWYTGAFTQPQNAYMAAKTGDASYPAYNGVCHIVCEHIEIGKSANLEVLHFGVAHYPDTLGLGAASIVGDDLNPMEFMYYLICQEWGGLDINPADIDTASWIAAGNTLHAEGNGISMAITSSNSGQDIIQEVLRQIDGILYQDPETGRLKIKLIRDDYNVEDLPVLDESNVSEITAFAVMTWQETINQVRVTHPSRDKEFEDITQMVQDMANINSQGRVRSITQSFPGAMTPALGIALATRSLSQRAVPVFSAELVTSRTTFNLRPGDPFIFSWDEYGIVSAVMRVQSFDLGELANGRIVIRAVQDRFAANQVVYAPQEASGWTPVNRTPADVVTAMVMETPYFFAQQIEQAPADGEAVISAIPVRPQTESAAVSAYVSDVDDNDEYALGYPATTYPPTGALTAPYLKTTGFLTGTDATGFTVGSVVGETLFEAATLTENRQGTGGVVVIGGEIMSYQTVTSLGGGLYRLGDVRRALLDTNFEDHDAGAEVYFYDASFVAEALLPDTVTSYTKFLDAVGGASQELTDVFPTTLLLAQRAQRPLPPDYITVGGARNLSTSVSNAGPTTIAWRHRSRLNDEIRFENDASDSPEEAGVTYRLEVWTGGVETVSLRQTGIVGNSTDVTFNAGVGPSEIRVYAVRDGLLSRGYAWYPVSITAPQGLTHTRFENSSAFGAAEITIGLTASLYVDLDAIAPVLTITQDSHVIAPANLASTTATTPLDPHFASVAVLLDVEHLPNGYNTAHAEYSDNRFTLSYAGGNGSHVDTAQSKFGTRSIRTNSLGGGGPVGVADQTIFNLGTQHFTAETWVRFATTNTTDFQVVFGQWRSSTNNRSWAVFFQGVTNRLMFYASVTGSASLVDIDVAWAPSTGVWYHVALDFDGTTYRLYVDGVQLGQSTTVRNLFNSNAFLTLGDQQDGNVDPLSGWFEDFRFTIGVARYKGAFTPPTTRHPRRIRTTTVITATPHSDADSFGSHSIS